MRGEKDRHLLFLVELLNVFPNMIACLRIKTNCRFVEKKYRRCMQQTASNLQTSLHTSRKRLYVCITTIAELNKCEQFFDTFLIHTLRYAVENGVKLHIFIRSKLIIETWILKDDAE